MKQRAFPSLLAIILILLAAGALQAADYYQSFEAEGLKITIDIWSTIGAPGYVPINLDITNPGPDRIVEITSQSQGYFSYSSGYYGQPRATSLSLTQQLRLKRGDRQRFTIALPVSSENENVQLQIRESGRVLHRAVFAFQTVASMDFTPALLVVNPVSVFGQAARDLPRTVFPSPAAGVPPGRAPFVATGTKPIDITREPERLPTNWLGYTTLRAVFIGKQEWDELSAPQKDALLAWTASGGDLSFVDGDWQTLFPDPQRRPTAIGLNSNAERYFLGQIFFPKVADLATKGLLNTLDAMRKQGPNGQRAAVPDPAIDIESAQKLRVQLDQLKSSSRPGYSGWQLPLFNPVLGEDFFMGATPTGFNGFRLPMPGVGVVSTRVYLAILVLFSLLIGPVNFWVLKKRRQQVLMVLTTPIISLIFIVLLSGYAVAGEGFGIRARAETFTFLDQSSKQAATQATVSLYAAGMAPWSGVRFPKDTAVFPTGDGRLSLDLTELQQFTSGLLQARAPANFQTVAFRTVRERLNFSRDGGSVTVVNGLDGTLNQLLYRDGGNIYALTGTVPTGGRGKLEAGIGKGLDSFLRPDGAFPSPITLHVERADKFRHFFLDSLADGAFLAVLDRSPFWEPGVDNIEERNSYHVVAGYAGGEP